MQLPLPYEVNLSLAFPHFFFCIDAAFLFPNKKAEVRLSAPVLLDIEDEPEKISAHRPQRPTIPDPTNTTEARDLTSLVLYEINEESKLATVMDPRSGWLGEALDDEGEGTGKVEEMFKMRAAASAASHIPKWRARKDSSGVRVGRRCSALSDKNSSKRGKTVRQIDNMNNMIAAPQAHKGMVSSFSS